MDMPDLIQFSEWVSCVNIPNMVQLAQNGERQGAFFLRFWATFGDIFEQLFNIFWAESV